MEQEACPRRRGRSRNPRRIGAPPNMITLKPRGAPMNSLVVLELRVEEMEAIRLVDLVGLDLKRASESMKVSRRTLTRDLKSGRRKLAEALVDGKAVVVTGGDFECEPRGEKM